MAVNKKLEALLALPAAERYDHFLKAVAEKEVVWGLWQGGWATLVDDVGREGLPVWPDRAAAKEFGKVMLEGWDAAPIEARLLLEEILPSIRADKGYVVVFPTIADSHWPELDQLEGDLRAALAILE